MVFGVFDAVLVVPLSLVGDADANGGFAESNGFNEILSSNDCIGLSIFASECADSNLSNLFASLALSTFLGLFFFFLLSPSPPADGWISIVQRAICGAIWLTI